MKSWKLFLIGWSLSLAANVAVAAEDIPVVPVTLVPTAGVYVADATVQAVRQSVVSAQVAGRVLQLAVRAGDAVKAGQLIARLDDRELGAAEASSQSAILEAQANLARAELDLKRTQGLQKQNFVSVAALDQAESQVKALRAHVDALRASAGAASATRSHALISAPYDGLVAMTQVEAGDMAMPGKPVVTLFQPGALRVVAYIPEMQTGPVRSGMIREKPVVELSGVFVMGVQVTLLPAADPNTRTTEVRVDLPASVQAMPGQFVRVRFALGADSMIERLSIPAAAVLKRGELTVVYVRNEEGRFRQRQVRLGEVLSQGRVEVLAGLKASDNVAVDPVKAGIAVAAKR